MSGSRQKAVLCLGSRESTRQQREVAEANARRLYFSKRAKRRVAARKGRSHLIAVQTVRNTDSTGAATCMLFDTQSRQIVGSLVYDCARVPKIGESVKFATYNATYVGG